MYIFWASYTALYEDYFEAAYKDKSNLFSQEEELVFTVPPAWSSVSSEPQSQRDTPWSDSWGHEGAPGGDSLSDSWAPSSQNWMVGS